MTLMHPADVVLEFYDRADQEIEKHLGLAADNGKPASCPTCTEAYCCYQPTAVTLIEGLPIARRLTEEGKNTSLYRKRLKELGEAMEGADKDAWFDARTPCPFLKDKRCTVYRERPMMSCRTYFVVTPVKLCNPAEDENPVVGNIDFRRAQAIMFKLAVDIERDMGLHDLGKEHLLLGSLPRMVWIWLECEGRRDWKEFIRSQPWIERQTGKEWFRGKNPFRKKGKRWIQTRRSEGSASLPRKS